MRLLLVTQDFPPDVGGIQTYSLKFAEQLERICDDFAVVAPSVDEGMHDDFGYSYPVYRVSGGTDALPVTAFPLLYRQLRRSFDTILLAQWPTLAASFLARKLTRKRVRVFVAAHGRELLFNPVHNWRPAQVAYDGLRRQLLQKVDGVFPVSHYTARLVQEQGVPSERIRVVHPGTDPDMFYPDTDSHPPAAISRLQGPTLLTVSRLVPRKGIDTVIRALPRIRGEVRDAEYVVVGKGPDRERLERLARDVGVASHVHFPGRMSFEALRAVYNHCDVFAMVSRVSEPSVEGFGIVYLEANACGKPVIGSRTGGIPDAIEDGETGILVDPDNPGELAAAAIRLLGDPDYAEKLGRNGWNRVQNELNWACQAETMVEYMRETN